MEKKLLLSTEVALIEVPPIGKIIGIYFEQVIQCRKYSRRKCIIIPA